MVKTERVLAKAGKSALALILGASLGFTGLASVGTQEAYADTPSTFWTAPTGGSEPASNLLKTYGVRAGSAGGDFMGVTNTNFDFTGGKASQQDQYSGYTTETLAGAAGAGLAIWATDVNENPNPYYRNLWINTVSGNSSLTQATTWMSNPESSSWGDSNGSTSNVGNKSNGAETVAGLEFSPDIIFGASKTCNWNLSADGKGSNTNFASAVANVQGYNPTFVNNDATNLYTQIYTMGQLATAANSVASANGKVTRYNGSDATQSAIDYEKAIRGQLLYVASKVDANPSAKKTVAYLYAIDDDGTGHFFIPEASGLLKGEDTGKSAGTGEEGATTQADATNGYASNNSTINMGYMATLPFVTNTFETSNVESITMKVEDIWKNNPACKVTSGDTAALKDVDVIIYNSTKNGGYTDDASNLAGTSGGKNSSGVHNAQALTKEIVNSWAKEKGFSGTQVLAGDDWGTSSNQNYGTAAATEDGMAPLLYCQRNYTADKDTRAAWAFSKVFPEYYNGNDDATYCYWVNNIYHVKTASVPAVAQYMTNQSSRPVYNDGIKNMVEANAEEGYNWWVNTGSKKSAWSGFAYYNGSSRASYYGGGTVAEEPSNTIGIFQPSTLWTNSHKSSETPQTPASGNVTMYRLYNPNSGEHFYTASAGERDVLKGLGWNDEGTGWIAPASGEPVYRMYNPYGGEHHYTKNANEKTSLENAGWNYEGIGWYSGGSVGVYRDYNPNAYANNHNYTPDQNEHNNLMAAGWTAEGFGWNAVAAK